MARTCRCALAYINLNDVETMLLDCKNGEHPMHALQNYDVRGKETKQ